MTKAYNNIQQIINDNPDWAAFLYLTDDLTTSDAVFFEDRLAERDDLQVALINATRMMAAVSKTAQTDHARTEAVPSTTFAIAAQVISRAGRRRRQTVVINVCCLSLCVLVAAIGMWNRSANRAANDFVVTAALDAELDAMFGDAEDVEADQEVLTAWVDIHETFPIADDEDLYSDSDLDVPDWMLTAVLLEEADAGIEVTPSGHDSTVPGRSESI